MRDFKITDFNYFGSTIGNAYFSGLTLYDVWTSMTLAKTPEELDVAISITIKLNELLNKRTSKK